MTPEGGRRERTSGLVETAPARHRLYQLIGEMNAGWRLAFPDDVRRVWYAVSDHKRPMIFECTGTDLPPMPYGAKVWGFYQIEPEQGIAVWHPTVVVERKAEMVN